MRQKNGRKTDTKNIDVLRTEKSNSIKKHNILVILNNVGAIFGAIIFTTKMCLKKQSMKEILPREQNYEGKD